MIPLEYDKEKGFEKWRRYIISESTSPYELFIAESNKSITNLEKLKAYSMNTNTQKYKVNGDRIVYALLIVLAIAYGLTQCFTK